MENCIFCKIVKKEIPANILYESEKVLAFPDINPIAPIHILIIPKEHLESINDLGDDKKDLAGELILTAKKIAEKLNIKESGYKLLIRVGKNGGQEVPHIHMHLIGGAKLSERITPVKNS